jgi:hypothetical protein
MTVQFDKTKLGFSTPKGTVSVADTLTMDAGRLGGRFHLYYEGDQAKYFKPAVPIGHKIKHHCILKMAFVFAPPASFTGTARGKLRIKGLSGNTWTVVDLEGTSTN